MITGIRIAPFGLFYYWEKPVTGRLGRSRQNQHLIALIRTQEWFSLSLENEGKWFQGVNDRIIANLHTPGITQIPIVLRHTVSPCLRPAVSSLGACPTPAL